MPARPEILALGGDAMLGRLVDESLIVRPPAEPWREIRPLVRDADAFIYNLECAVCSDVPEWEPLSKVFHFRLDRERAKTLLESGVSAVQLANNHIMDHGAEGLLETIRILDALGIPHAGAGRDLAQAREPAVLPNGIGLVAAADHLREWAASERHPGIFLVDPYSPDAVTSISDAIATARERGAGIVIVGLHWGPNMRRTPAPAFQRFARSIIEEGATIVWGTSAHLFQGIEFHEHGVILYDTGELVDDYAVDPVERNDISFLFYPHLREDATVEDVTLRPILIEDFRTRPAPPSEAAWAARRMAELSRPMGTDLVEEDGAWRACKRHAETLRERKEAQSV